MNTERVGILALQGDFVLHQAVFSYLGVEVMLVKRAEELAKVDRLVIPGGESSTMQLLMDEYDLRQPLIEFGQHKPIWGTCAGLVLLANKVTDPLVKPLGLIDITVERNAYGSQINSFVATGAISLRSKAEPFEMVFIRAPRIMQFSSRVKVLGSYADDVTIARQNSILVSTFHPELTQQTTIHEYFLDI